MICDASYWEGKKVPGQPQPKAAAWAAWIRVTGVNGPIKKGGLLKLGPVKTSAWAELYAALNGVWIAAQYGATSVLVRSDCLEVVKVLNEEAFANNKKWQAYRKAVKEHSLEHLDITAKHVRAHTEDFSTAAAYVNDWCDREAKRHMRKDRKEKYGYGK